MRTLRTSRRGLAWSAVLLGGALTLTACGSGSSDAAGHGHGAKTEAASKKSSVARITVASKNGAENASINDGADVKVSRGKLTDVKMVQVQGGAAVDGKIAADGRSWKPAEQLDRATEYKITATAKDSAGRKAVENTTFTTVSPANSFIGTYTGEDGETFGVGMPVSFNFDKAISDKKAVQSAIKVSSSSGQQVVGHWFNGNRLDFRPENYWKPNSTVTVRMKLDGVKGAPGIEGVQNTTFRFHIGRSQISYVDAKTHQMKVVRDGKVLRTIPISSGSDEHPTYNGKMVISEKDKETRMDGNTVGFGRKGKEGFDIKDVPHAMRLSTSGTFIHGNYWGAPFGSGNTSHGCVGLQDDRGANNPHTPAAWFYDQSLIGDVVDVKNNPDKTIQPDNGLNGWNMSWAAWKAGSAV